MIMPNVVLVNSRMSRCLAAELYAGGNLPVCPSVCLPGTVSHYSFTLIRFDVFLV